MLRFWGSVQNRTDWIGSAACRNREKAPSSCHPGQASAETAPGVEATDSVYSFNVARGTKKKSIGWREWVEMPDLGVAEIKAKVDTGADNSSLHAFRIERYEESGIEMVRFQLHPHQRKRRPVVDCIAEVVKERRVKNPGGRTEIRPVIRTRLVVAGREIDAHINLTTRDEMTFRMLLGRRTIRSEFVVDPGRSYLGGRPTRVSVG
jgi:hypothetical protein